MSEQSLLSSLSSGVRASDEDRERVVAELHEHAVAGRLSIEELEERTRAAYAARTTAELEALRRDLPTGTRAAALWHVERRALLTRRLVQETGGSGALFLLCCAVWLASGGGGGFWPVWVLIVVLLSLARNGWALYGPAPDFDAVEQSLDRHGERRLERIERRERRAR